MPAIRKLQLAVCGFVAALFVIFCPAHPAHAHSRPGNANHATTEATSPGISWIVMDAETGEVLGKNDAYTLRYPASLTKLMTLDLAFEALRDHQITMTTDLPVSPAATEVQPVKLNLVPGQTISVHQAMLGMTTLSANDAATALGEYLGHGSMQHAASEMTEQAHKLGMLRTEFTNTSGLPDPRQVTDAYDMAILARHILLAYPQYRYLFSVPSFMFEGRRIPNIDGMLKLYPGAIGMKTGYTDLARFNLVTAAVRDGHLLIGVELHAKSWRVAYHTMARLLDRGFAADHAETPHLVVADNTAPAVSAPTVVQPAPRHEPAHESVARRSRNKLRVAENPPGHVTEARIPGWTAQVGAYDRYKDARRQALLIHDLRHDGTARVDKKVVHGHRIWRAQIAGLDHEAAQRTCELLARRHQSCFVIGPSREHIAMR